MPKPFLRLIALLLIPCLLADPVTAAAWVGPLFRATSSVVDPSRFSEEALSAAALTFFHAPRHLAARLWRAAADALKSPREEYFPAGDAGVFGPMLMENNGSRRPLRKQDIRWAEHEDALRFALKGMRGYVTITQLADKIGIPRPTLHSHRDILPELVGRENMGRLSQGQEPLFLSIDDGIRYYLRKKGEIWSIKKIADALGVHRLTIRNHHYNFWRKFEEAWREHLLDLSRQGIAQGTLSSPAKGFFRSLPVPIGSGERSDDRKRVLELMEVLLNKWESPSYSTDPLVASAEKELHDSFGYDIVVKNDAPIGDNILRDPDFPLAVLAERLGFGRDVLYLPIYKLHGRLMFQLIASELTTNQRHAGKPVLLLAREIKADGPGIELLARDLGAGFMDDVEVEVERSKARFPKRGRGGVGLTTTLGFVQGGRGTVAVETGGLRVVYGASGILETDLSDIEQGTLITVRRFAPKKLPVVVKRPKTGAAVGKQGDRTTRYTDLADPEAVGWGPLVARRQFAAGRRQPPNQMRGQKSPRKPDGGRESPETVTFVNVEEATSYLSRLYKGKTRRRIKKLGMNDSLPEIVQNAQDIIGPEAGNEFVRLWAESLRASATPGLLAGWAESERRAYAARLLEMVESMYRLKPANNKAKHAVLQTGVHDLLEVVARIEVLAWGQLGGGHSREYLNDLAKLPDQLRETDVALSPEEAAKLSAVEYRSFGAKLKAYRSAAGLTVAQLARKVDIPASTIREFEKDWHLGIRPTPSQAIVLGQFLSFDGAADWEKYFRRSRETGIQNEDVFKVFAAQVLDVIKRYKSKGVNPSWTSISTDCHLPKRLLKNLRERHPELDVAMAEPAVGTQPPDLAMIIKPSNVQAMAPIGLSVATSMTPALLVGGGLYVTAIGLVTLAITFGLQSMRRRQGWNGSAEEIEKWMFRVSWAVIGLGLLTAGMGAWSAHKSLGLVLYAMGAMGVSWEQPLIKFNQSRLSVAA